MKYVNTPAAHEVLIRAQEGMRDIPDAAVADLPRVLTIGPGGATLKEIKTRVALLALQATGSQKAAAEALDVSERSVQSWLRQAGWRFLARSPVTVYLQSQPAASDGEDVEDVQDVQAREGLPGVSE